MEKNKFSSEWSLLQNQFDSYEKHSLYIKLIAVIVLLIAIISNVITIPIFLILVVLWLQDAVWKTFQSRIETRLLQLEKYISADSSENVCQFNSEYHKVSLSGLTLIKEYACQSIRPTVAFPHVVLIFILLVQHVL
ncbi:hypothetical protein H4J57_09575 [Colwellia sp. BRX8-7]|jgi:hypothetical protein|uniref:hypothetical protein n=1 Tax=Colwellia sp. BRX8-7 TaxID=2759833 RepID=UPI0015F57761|nr:hypothetical protein [Colwellia sp. BRX8-7]MBA6337450.1 hypothetical protein [Colwellia sp. BRX8-7]